MASITLDQKKHRDNKRNKESRGALRVDRGKRGIKTSSAVNLLDKQGRLLGTVIYDSKADSPIRIEWEGEMQLTGAQPVLQATAVSAATSTQSQPNNSTAVPATTTRQRGGCTSCGRRRVSA